MLVEGVNHRLLDVFKRRDWATDVERTCHIWLKHLPKRIRVFFHEMLHIDLVLLVPRPSATQCQPTLSSIRLKLILVEKLASFMTSAKIQTHWPNCLATLLQDSSLFDECSEGRHACAH